MNAAEFALQEMIRGLERQSNVLVELRQRASIVLSASGSSHRCWAPRR